MIPQISPTPSNTPSNTATITPTSTSCPLFITPTRTPSVTNTPTNTITPTMTPTPSTIAFDPDAATYLSQVLFAGGTGITATVSGATDTLYKTLKACGVYSKISVMYPFLGGVANSTAINGINPSLFFIQWNGGLTHNYSGVTGNGTNGYGNTGFKHNTLPVNQIHYSIFQNTQNTNLRADETQIGNIGNLAPEWLLQTRDPVGGGIFDNVYRLGATGSGNNIRVNNGGVSAGCFIAARSGTTTTTAYRNNVQQGQATGTYTNTATGRDIYLLAMNLSNTVYGDSYSNNRIAFASIGSGLTRSEVTCLNDAIVNFNTTLGRVF